MSVAKLAGDVAKNLPNASKLAIVKKPGHMAVPKIANDLTVEMLPKSQIPKSGRVEPTPDPWFYSYLAPVAIKYAKFSIPKTLGMRMDDWMYDESVSPVIQEALKRVDNDEVQLRAFRQMRASQLAFERMVCPAEERWDLENDVRYLKPWVDQAAREADEADAWDSY